MSPAHSLFEDLQYPHGLQYRPDFLTADEEASYLAAIEQLPLKQAKFQQYTARRRVVRYGDGEYPACYGAEAENSNPRQPFPEFLKPLRSRVANWLDRAPEDFVHALVTEYQPGTPIGWHSDAPHFGAIVGISLGGAARMQFRPYAAKGDRKSSITIELARRSAYVLQHDIRWKWQHHIPPVRALRYSITVRTLRESERE